jgi:sec-independent protein translocase protein TatA
MFGGDLLQPTHIILILVVALIVLGPKRLPEVGRSLGRGLRDFRQGISGVQDEARGMFSDALDEPSDTPEDSAVSLVPEPITPATAEPVAQSAPVFAGDPVAAPAPAPTAATVTKVTPVEPDPADYAD